MTLYIIGGASRSGKTHLAKSVLSQFGVPYFSTDFLRQFIKNSGVDFGLTPDCDNTTKAHKIWPGLEGMLRAHVKFQNTYLVEGDLLRPKELRHFMRDHKDADIRVCFLGYDTADWQEKFDQVRAYQSEDIDWSASLSDAALLSHIESAINFSKALKKECAECDLPYIDTSQDFEVKIEGAINSLIKP